MSSAPSASALSAVLRCRRNIWAGSAAHSPGAEGSPDERARPLASSTLEAIGPRERVMLGNILTVVVEADVRVPRNNRVSDPKLWREGARGTASWDPNAPERHLARGLKCASIYTSYKLDLLSALFLRISLSSTRVIKTAGEIPFSAFPEWATVKSACLSLTRLVSECVFLRLLVVLCRSSIRSLDGPPHLPGQLAVNITNGSLHVSARDLRTFTE